jgi:hypothetical protein
MFYTNIRSPVKPGSVHLITSTRCGIRDAPTKYAYRGEKLIHDFRWISNGVFEALVECETGEPVPLFQQGHPGNTFLGGPASRGLTARGLAQRRREQV